MSAFVRDLREVGGGLRSRIRRLLTLVARATALPLVVKGAIWFWVIVALVVAVPTTALLTPPGIPLLLFGALAAAAPRTRMVTAALLAPMVAWVVATAAFGTPASPVRLLLLASSLYLAHSSAALAAQLPYDAIVSPAVVLRWFGRTAVVLAGTALVGLYVLLAGQLFDGAATLLATVVGFAVAVGVVGLLSRLLRRP